MSRSFGARLLTTRFPILILPSAINSRPAIMRKSVDFPQPDGPTKVTNSPSATEIDIPWMTSTPPYDLRTLTTSTDAIVLLLSQRWPTTQF